jgi:cellulose synthase (UDP-forming)
VPGRRLRVACLALLVLACSHPGETRSRDARARELDELHALWSFYAYRYIEDGRVVTHDEGGHTTSEGQGYAMLRAVWSGDRATFDRVWRWTRDHLQVRADRLLAWKWKGRVLDANAATDADQDVALALLLAARRFGDEGYRRDARAILADLWKREVVRAGDLYVATGGNWAPGERYPTVHVGYLAPYAYEVFAAEDPERPWRELVRSSYLILRWIYFDRNLSLPPEKIWLEPGTGAFLLQRPGDAGPQPFGYDAVPIFWRVALDARWFGRAEHDELRARMLEFFRQTFREEGRLRERYTLAGRPLSALDGLPHLATVHALAVLEDRELAAELRSAKLEGLWERALAGEETPYYLQNWLWFDRALEHDVARRYDEALGFLGGIDLEETWAHLPFLPLAGALLLWPFARRFRAAKVLFLLLAFGFSIRYLAWRATGTLNFVEPLGPIFSGALLLAELYAFSTVALLLVQVGLDPLRRRPAPTPLAAGEHVPSVDVMIPIYSESLEILDKTLAAACAMRWASKTVWVCDDSHRPEVEALAAEHGARYLRGPKKHAKAGNLNAALAVTEGELVVVFDTDHVPAAAFLERTVPLFRDEGLGMVQTPHHMYNPDVFQRAFGAGAAVPNEQDLFNHAIQGARDGWGGAFFVGSGAVFRRSAIASVGGFNLLSITEDIHTSQKLHAKGWRSAFVDEDLAVGLAAENLASYLVQRRRWMLGCLQIFFKDNPLLERGLSLRQRVGYFASLWYFFFPIARVVFFATPLLYLLFHLHPLFADLSVLLAYLGPHLLLVPLASGVILPGWPRALWGSVYESIVAFPLFRAMFDLVLPKRLGFKVTPKGIVADRRRFDLASVGLTVGAAALAVVAIAKGIAEWQIFGIEREAYAFNLFWAALNVTGLVGAIAVAWERPQRRGDERVRRRLPARIEGAGEVVDAETVDLGVGGAGVTVPSRRPVPAEGELVLSGAEALRLPYRLAWSERTGGVPRAGLAFVGLSAEARRALVRVAFAADGAFTGAHDARSRSQLGMALRLLAGLVRAVLPERPRRRRAPRDRILGTRALVRPGGAVRVLLTDRSATGLGLLVLGAPPEEGDAVAVLSADAPVQRARVVHVRRLLPGLWRAGLAFGSDPVLLATPPRLLLAA